MKIDRRQALALVGLGAATPAVAASPTDVRFHHGVASGDPAETKLVIWTRVTSASDGVIAVRWEVAETPDFARPVASGVATAAEARDHTVKIDVGGLRPGREYFYRFKAGPALSPVGRGRTLPAGPTSDVVLAVASCSLYPGGYFNAYQAIADLPRVDAVLHLGDYIYEYALEEYGAETGKLLNRLPDPPHECVTLADYRRRHACHRTDTQLQAAHARAPWIVVWDDHETANDSWKDGAENHNPDKGEGDWATRKAAAVRAWYEWMPIREPARDAAGLQAWRSFRFGDLASLLMIETRLSARDHQLSYAADLKPDPSPDDVAAFRARLEDPARRMMGPLQHAWVRAELAASQAAGHAWQVIGNQVVMARVTPPNLLAGLSDEQQQALAAETTEAGRRRLERIGRLNTLGLPYNLDAWDGYPADRERLYDAFKAAGAHPIVLSGDSHVFWVNELWDQAGKTRVAAELGATGITSPGAGDQLKSLPLNRGFNEANREVIHTDQAAKGFVLLTLTRAAAKAELVTVSTIFERAYKVETRKTFEISPVKSGGVAAIREL